MAHANADRVSNTQILIPMTIVGFLLAFFFMFQMAQVMRDRDALHQTIGRQEAPYTESQKLNTQFGGLVVGTQKLAKEGNATALDLEKRLKQIGVIQDASKNAQNVAPVPVAKEQKAPGPVKP